MTQFTIKISLAKLLVVAAALLLIAGPAAPRAIACAEDGSEPYLINGELPGGG